MGWVKGSGRNFEASQTERYRKTKKDRRERRETSVGDPKIRVRGRGSSTCAQVVVACGLHETCFGPPVNFRDGDGAVLRHGQLARRLARAVLGLEERGAAHVEEAAENLRARIQPRGNVQDGAGCMFDVARGAHLPIALFAVAESDWSANALTTNQCW